MSLYLNYRLTLKSGEVFETYNGGIQGPTRDVFINKDNAVILYNIDDVIQDLRDIRDFKVTLFGNFPNDLYTNFPAAHNYDGTVFKIDINLLTKQTDIDEFLQLLDYTYYLEIDDDYLFSPAEHEAFRRAFIEEDFEDANTSDQAIQRKLAIRKRWFIEYFKNNLFLGFRKNTVQSFDFTVD